MNTSNRNLEEKFIFTSAAKRSIIVIGIIGIIAFVLGIVLLNTGGHGDHAADGSHAGTEHHSGTPHGNVDTAHHEEAGGHHETLPVWLQRVYSNLWINNVYFTGIAVIGFFFFALQYAAQAGWSASIKRVPMAFANWLPIAFVLMLGVFLVANKHLFHWTHDYLYDEKSPLFDPIINGKKGYLNMPFYLIRMVLYFVIWYVFFRILRNQALQEDIHGGTEYWYKMRKYAAIFIVLFAVTVSTSGWDWVMSIDTHWFSTMFGWYVFASWWVTGLAAITLVVVILKDQGYLSIVNSNHLHDLGKFCFAFSVFWTYIWFSQFMLIYYANIPEETIYFVERLGSSTYKPIFFMNIFLNFVFPFLLLMTRDAKRQTIFLKIVCAIIMVGHWFDFYLMITPGTLKGNGGVGFLEIGLALIYLSAFAYTIFASLSKVPLIAKNHPMLQESIHHHI